METYWSTGQGELPSFGLSLIAVSYEACGINGGISPWLWLEVAASFCSPGFAVVGIVDSRV